jgi:hypothetical protein
MKNNDNASSLLSGRSGVLLALFLANPNVLGVLPAHADEPSLLFYSAVPGSGNSNVYVLTLPADPPNLPRQDGTGGTFNFQLHPAFWFGMAMCDTQSYPNQLTTCTPDSDSNIAPLAKHAGTAIMEMQFYPPGWVAWPPGNSCDPFKWCAVLNIDSLSEDPINGLVLNATCQAQIFGGVEYINFAFITKDGNAIGPANPVDLTLASLTPDPAKVLLMNRGDKLVVSMQDTADGFQVVIKGFDDEGNGLDDGQHPNHFGQVQFAPAGTTCTNIPYAFHPMYSTSSEQTRVPWAAHSYNIAFSDEIGHFEYCNRVDSNGNCTQAGVNDPSGIDGGDTLCFPATNSTRIGISGCTDTDDDFDGVSYQLAWPGSLQNRSQDVRFNPRSVQFTSPLFMPAGGGKLVTIAE